MMHSGLPPVPFARPDLGEAEANAARDAVLSGWVTQGPRVAAFEAAFAQACGAPYACAVSSATTALHLALLAVAVRPGDEVVTVSHSFIATANAVRYCGARPVFVDIDPATYNLDPGRLAEAIGPKTRAVLCVHQIGMPCDMTAILRIARRARRAGRRGCGLRDRQRDLRRRRPARAHRSLAGHGDIACFSFHPRKVLTTGDGGMLTTRDPQYDARFRLLRQHAMNVSDAARHSAREVIFESYGELGYNYRMTDIQAAVGLEQLKRLPALVARRRALAARYHALLSAIPGLGIPAEPEWARSNWQSYAVRLPEGRDQRAVMQALLDRGISSRRGVMCAHLEKVYADVPLRFPLPHSEAARDRTILLPLFPQMTQAEQDRVVSALADACR